MRNTICLPYEDAPSEMYFRPFLDDDDSDDSEEDDFSDDDYEDSDDEEYDDSDSDDEEDGYGKKKKKKSTTTKKKKKKSTTTKKKSTTTKRRRKPSDLTYYIKKIARDCHFKTQRKEAVHHIVLEAKTLISDMATEMTLLTAGRKTIDCNAAQGVAIMKLGTTKGKKAVDFANSALRKYLASMNSSSSKKHIPKHTRAGLLLSVKRVRDIVKSVTGKKMGYPTSVCVAGVVEYALRSMLRELDGGENLTLGVLRKQYIHEEKAKSK